MQAPGKSQSAFSCQKYIFAWLPMILIVIGNGAVRETWYKHLLGEQTANQVSVATGCLLLGIYIRGVIRRWPPGSLRQAADIGVVWVLLTVLFEFGFGHYVRGVSWPALLHDYDLAAGRLWPLVLAWVGTSPMVFCKRQRK